MDIWVNPVYDTPLCIASCKYRCHMHVTQLSDIDDASEYTQRDLSDECDDFVPEDEVLGDC